MIIPSATITIHHNGLEILLATHYFLSIFVVTKSSVNKLLVKRIDEGLAGRTRSFVVNNRGIVIRGW